MSITKDDQTFHRAFAGMPSLRRAGVTSHTLYYLQEIKDYLRAYDGNDVLHPDEEFTQIVDNKMVVDDKVHPIVEVISKTFRPKSVERRSQVFADYALKVWAR